MGVKRVWSTTGVVALTGALLLTSAPGASADYIRDKQWPLAAFDSKDVWAQSQGQGVTVAVVDTGVDSSLPDLTGQVLAGKDFTEDGRNARQDTDGHGTALAAIIAAHGHGTGNSSGVIGLAPKAKILPVRVSQTDDDLNSTTWGQGIRYAVDHGASVINLSFIDTGGTPGSDGAKAIAYAQEHNVVVVAGAGNEGADQIDYPAALPGVVSVGAVDNSLKVVNYSNYGKSLVLAAPGVDIAAPSSTASSGYSSLGGTSEATAFVSAEAALIRAKFPKLTAGQVINRMIKSAKSEGSKSPDEHYGYGIIRPYSALTDNIPTGPKQGPLAQAPVVSKSAGAPGAEGSSPSSDTAASPSKGSSSNLLLIVVGVVAVLVIIVVVLVVVLRRRNRGGPGGGSGGSGGTPVAGAGYPPYPGQAPQNGPGAPYGQFGPPSSPYQPQPGNAPNPYRQQPPYQGQ